MDQFSVPVLSPVTLMALEFVVLNRQRVNVDLTQKWGEIRPDKPNALATQWDCVLIAEPDQARRAQFYR